MNGSKDNTFYQIKEGCWIMFSNDPKQNAFDEKIKINIHVRALVL